MRTLRKLIDFALSSDELPPGFTLWCLAVFIVAIAVLAGAFQ